MLRRRSDLETDEGSRIAPVDLFRLCRHLIDRTRPDRPFERDLRLAGAAEQRMHRDAEGAAEQVVQGHVEHGEGGGVRRQPARHVAQHLLVGTEAEAGGDRSCRHVRPAPYFDFGRPSTFSAMCDLISSALTGAMRGIMASRISRSTWNSLA